MRKTLLCILSLCVISLVCCDGLASPLAAQKLTAKLSSHILRIDNSQVSSNALTEAEVGSLLSEFEYIDTQKSGSIPIIYVEKLINDADINQDESQKIFIASQVAGYQGQSISFEQLLDIAQNMKNIASYQQYPDQYIVGGKDGLPPANYSEDDYPYSESSISYSESSDPYSETSSSDPYSESSISYSESSDPYTESTGSANGDNSYPKPPASRGDAAISVEDQLRQAFDHVDADHSGKVSNSEIKKSLSILGRYPTDEEAAGLMEKYDLNKDGDITFEEFKKVMLGFDNGDADRELKAAFRSFDVDGNGVITYDEGISALVKSGRADSEQTADHMFKQADLDADGVVNFEEFRSVVNKKD